MSERTVLLKMYRQFEHDEVVNYLKDIIRQRDMEIGKLKSELAEAEYNLKQANEKE